MYRYFVAFIQIEVPIPLLHFYLLYHWIMIEDREIA